MAMMEENSMASFTSSDPKTPLLPPVSSINRLSSNSSNDGFPKLGSTRFNFLLLKRLLKILRILFPGCCSVTLAFVFFLIFVRISAEYNFYFVGLIASRFYSSFTEKNLGDFKNALYQSVIIVLSACICKSASELVANIIYVRWRALLTAHVHTLYFSNINYYKLNVTNKAIDNPDQRITQDIERFCNQVATELLPKLVLWPFIIIYYTYKTYITMGYEGVLVIYIYFVLATVVNKFLMGPVVALIVEQEKKEGNFRFHHVSIRNDAESIALYSGENVERFKANQYMTQLLKTQLGVAHWMFPLNFSVNLFDYISSVVTYTVIGIMVFSGGYDSLSLSELAAQISQNAFFSLYLLNNFSVLIDQTSNMADVAGYTHRIGQLLEALNMLSNDHNVTGSTTASSYEPFHDNEAVGYSIAGTGTAIVAAEFEDVTIGLPRDDHNILIEGLRLIFKKGTNVVVLGASGSGKSSLLRVLRKLWLPVKGSATIRLAEQDTEVMIIPQKPHLTSGSLIDQIMYPKQHKEIVRTEDLSTHLLEDPIEEALHLAGLISLRDRLGGVGVVYDGNWNDYVSPGEMQKIAFARLFYHKPSFAYEATSSLSEEDENYLYTTVRQMGITVFSIGHRSTIIKYHQLMLQLNGYGSWQLTPVHEN